MMKKLSDLMRYIESGLFFGVFLFGIISTKLTALIFMSFLITLLIHFAIDHEYLVEWTDYIFGKDVK